jgi:23S rRNA pseudouridine1911/1915/1917 synthase
MVVHPAAGNWTGTLVNALLHKVTDLEGVGDALRPGLVHRLDKETTGCVVVAKTAAALTRLQASFKSRDVEKLYLAIVRGAPPDEGTFSTLHGRHPRNRKKFSGKVREGKPAVTHFRTLARADKVALVEATLETGRTHQIRVHFAEAGYPLLGDALYGVKSEAISRQALHAWKLAFPHPRTGKRLQLEAPLPDDFSRALKTLGLQFMKRLTRRS